LPALSTPGFPVEVMKAGLLKRRQPPSTDNLPPWINDVRAWLAVDPRHARERIPEQVETRRVDMRVVRLLIDTDLSGLVGDWARVDRNFEVLASIFRPVDTAPRWPGATLLRSVMAFWYAVQERYPEAAESLALAGPVQDQLTPPLMGGDASYGLLETAQVRILRATGRDADARRLLDEVLARLRTARKSVGDGCEWPGMYPAWMRLASLAANEGLKDEAVDALLGAFRCGELPSAFQPQLPWFRAMEGYAPYDALLKERDRRIAKVRPELERLEQAASALAPASSSTDR
jgi:hypothetical protein